MSAWHTAEYSKATAGLPVVKTIYMEVDAPAEHRVTEAEFISGLCHEQDNRLVAAVIGGRPASDHFAEYLARFKDNRCIKGVRDILFETPERCLERPFLRGVRHLGELGEFTKDTNLNNQLCIKLCRRDRFPVSST